MNIMHTVTSHKGGVGKTITSLSLAHHYLLDKKNQVIIVDTNPMNSDIADNVFAYFHQESFTPCPMIRDAIKRVYTIAPDSARTFDVIDASHLRLGTVIKMISEHQKLDPTGNDVYIIDTNEHIKNLYDLPTLDCECWRQYFWFIWGWSTPRLHHNISDIFRSVKTLERSYPIRQVVHVFNMYAFFDTQFSLRKKASVTLKPLFKVLKEFDRRISRAAKGKTTITYANTTMIRAFIEEVRRDLLTFIIPRDLDISHLPEIWASSISQWLSTTLVPYNMLLIPTFFEELVMSMDRLTMGEHRSWGEIYTALRPMMKYIAMWMSVLEQHGK